MLFSTLTVSAFGLAAVAIAAPSHLQSRYQEIASREPSKVVARGLTWQPKKRQSSISDLLNFNSFGGDNKFNNDFFAFQQETIIIITEQENNRLDSGRFQQEEQFSQLIQEQLFLLQVQSFMCDNIRRNHFNNRNRNVNTIIIIVQEVIDNRFGNNNRRYFTRQIESNSRSREQIVVIIQETNIINIGGQSLFSGTPTGSFGAQSTDSARIGGESQRGTYVPNESQFGGFNSNINLLPEGIDVPQFGFGRQDVDPAIIVQQSQQVFISFSDSDNQRKDDNARGQQSFGSDSISLSDII
ncbi:hypothetical protein BJ875DRAFT_1564 [Amylocarpus encephaloides]|uniref:Uncharacterized protein n=1 Tax=Amylocarpus encephaloides TaxID=45428 RepID=A0A9P7YTK2_9HELO|nr:hypothetical protein BJ875DRAFT_1564 [Amylocarpus encephaloides]